MDSNPSLGLRSGGSGGFGGSNHLLNIWRGNPVWGIWSRPIRSLEKMGTSTYLVQVMVMSRPIFKQYIPEVTKHQHTSTKPTPNSSKFRHPKLLVGLFGEWVETFWAGKPQRGDPNRWGSPKISEGKTPSPRVFTNATPTPLLDFYRVCPPIRSVVEPVIVESSMLNASTTQL